MHVTCMKFSLNLFFKTLNKVTFTILKIFEGKKEMEIIYWRRIFLCVAVFFFLSTCGFAQVIQAGLKGGYQLSWVNTDDKLLKEGYYIKPVSGFNAGAVLAFKVRERFFLHSEYIYSTKGKRVTMKKNAPGLLYDSLFSDKVVYSYAEVPVMFSIHFKGNVGKGKQFKWYFGAGPNFSYWLGGRGTITSEQIIFEYPDPPDIEYKLKLNQSDQIREDQDDPETVHLNNVNRLQLGIIASLGLVFEPAPRQVIMFDVRYEAGGTRLGKKDSFSDYIFPTFYEDNLKVRNHGIRVSLIYLYQTSTDKKTRNKGKSTIKNNKRNTLRRK